MKKQKVFKRTTLYLPREVHSRLVTLALYQGLPLYKIIWMAIHQTYGEELGVGKSWLELSLTKENIQEE